MEIMQLVVNRSRELEELEFRFLKELTPDDEWHVKEPVWYKPPSPPAPPPGKYRSVALDIKHSLFRASATEKMPCNHTAMGAGFDALEFSDV